MEKTYPKGYIKVAEVDTDDMEQAFAMTQHVERSWAARDGIKLLVPARTVRSTSMGDVLVKDGRPYYVRPIGFEPITTEDF
jgi:hypothetical protein